MLRTARGARGFTFIELMMTLALMAVLVVVAVPMAQLAVQRQKEHELREALSQIRDALDAYKRASDQGRLLVRLGQSGYPKTLDELVEGVDDQRSVNKRKLYFLRRLPRNPINADLTLAPAATWALRSYAAPPDAPAEGDDVFDVYVDADTLGLNGVPYRQW